MYNYALPGDTNGFGVESEGLVCTIMHYLVTPMGLV